MGKGHTRAQRMRWAHLTRSVPINEVATKAGVKRRTVQSWRTEFGITGGEVTVHSAVGRIRLVGDQAASGADARLTDAATATNEFDVEAEVHQATSRYIEQHGDWFHDEEGRQSDKKEMHEVISDWEGQHGPLTPQEKAEARAALGL
ncbi:MAG: hypothetical protein F4217_04285 [Acidimicrobiaceae bacterium]|nr:hypothetical protein [Acidimicrobiaceae bacterium]